jgi:hypothetical protein
MVVFITAIIFTTATSMIALVTTDYKHRINESKKLQNLYEAESELDIVNNVIVKNCDAAVEYANAHVRQYLVTNGLQIIQLNNTNEQIYNDANNHFKDFFLEFLGTNQYNDVNPVVPANYGLAVYNTTHDELIYGILNKRYPQLKKAEAGTTERDSTQEERLLKTYDPAIGGDYRYVWKEMQNGTVNANKQAAQIEILSYTYDNTNNKITIQVRSTFNSTNNPSDGALNKKVITTKFIVNAPDYEQDINTISRPTNTNAYPIEKAIVADGDLNVVGGRTVVKGDVWIKGREVGNISDPNYAIDKYNAGIFIDNGTFNVQTTTLMDGTVAGGNVYTSKTFGLKNRGISSIANKLYTLNTYLGPLTSGGTSTGNSLTASEVVTNNDLTLNADNSTMDITNYYGINDITTPDNEIVPTNAAIDSSSIIVNNHTNSSQINIAGSAYVNGVSYVNTDRSYATGESVGIRGNYKAYGDKLPNDNKEYLFENYSPLYLVAKQKNEGVMNDMTPRQKADYFANYYNSGTETKPTNFPISSEGIKINSLFAIGAYPNGVMNNYTTSTPVANAGGNINENATLTINDKKRAFARLVFGMGTESLNTDELAMASYLANSVTTTVANQVSWTTDTTSINPQYVPEYIPVEATEAANPNLTEAHGKFIYNKNSDVTVRITRDYIEVGTMVNGTMVNPTQIDAKIGDDNIYQKAVIVTKGNVVVEDGVKFKGTIIACGNVDINSTATSDVDATEIKYDEDLVLNITAKYNTQIDNLFLGNPLSNRTQIVMDAEKIMSTVQDRPLDYIELKYDSDKYLKKGLWKIEK